MNKKQKEFIKKTFNFLGLVLGIMILLALSGYAVYKLGNYEDITESWVMFTILFVFSIMGIIAWFEHLFITLKSE